ncbi:MAG: DUF1592 domain-containing protein, partial [Myxococcaceae bacterium]|nr:DUF1592 domain-containing protein [Myxococcaceae bacterium]
ACVGNISRPVGGVDEHGNPIPVSPTGGGDELPTGPQPEVIPPFEPAALKGRLLLSWQYTNTIRDVLGPAAAAAVTPPADVALNGLTAIGAGAVTVSTSSVTKYETNAYAAAAAAQLSYGCAPTVAIDDACFGRFLDIYGKRLFRRPLTAEERTTWTNVQHQAAMAYSSFTKGVEFALAGLLQSPGFLYRFETGAPEGQWVKLTPYEVATRLSFFIVGTTPSDALLTAAENGELDTADGIRNQASLLIGQSGVGEAAAHFFDEVLDQHELEHLGKDRTTFPTFDNALVASMREELHHIITSDAFTTDFRNLIDSDHTYVDAKLAGLYGVQAPASGWARVTLPADQPRAGLLGTAGFLALKAHPVSSSPTLRGKLVREKFLCEAVGAPPPDVDTNLPDPVPGVNTTLRERLMGHLTAPSCAGCHKLMDPLGFAFENFDAIGAHRTLDNTKPVDATGALDKVTFTDAKGLAAALKADKRVMRCLTNSMYRQASGHVELYSETASLRAAEKAFIESGYQLRFLLVELAASDAFRYGRAP